VQQQVQQLLSLLLLVRQKLLPAPPGVQLLLLQWAWVLRLLLVLHQLPRCSVLLLVHRSCWQHQAAELRQPSLAHRPSLNHLRMGWVNRRAGQGWWGRRVSRFGVVGVLRRIWKLSILLLSWLSG
jgi:hypothetical protein